MKPKNHHWRKHAFTLIELLVVIAIIAVLAALGMAGLSRARESANSVKSASNLRTISSAFSMYAADNSGRYPVSAQHTTGFTGVWWWDLVRPYLSAPNPVLLSDPNPAVRALSSGKTVLLNPFIKVNLGGTSTWPNIGYAINGYPTGLPLAGDITMGKTVASISPATTFLLAESEFWFSGGWYGPKLADEFAFRPNGSTGVLMFDGHVERFTKQQLQDPALDKRLKGESN